jgi:hypothetical protein
VAKKVCRYCGNYFVPDRRVGDRQKACSVACQKVRKRENNKAYREKDPEYWRAPERYEYLKAWRQKHPDYQRRWREARKRKRRSLGEIQAERLKKAIEFTERIHIYLCEIKAEIPLKVLSVAAKKALISLPG